MQGWRITTRRVGVALLSVLWALGVDISAGAVAAPTSAPSPALHGFAQFGAPKYGPGFDHVDYVNPNAPKGGEIKLAEMASFDSLNPFILKGVKAPGTQLVFESLMTSSLDEPQSVYGLIAESVRFGPEREWAEFTLRREARWHDGSAITPADVVFSFETLRDKGDPVYKIIYAPIAKVEQTGPLTVRFTFTTPVQRDIPFIAATMPIFSKAYYTAEKTGHDFEKTTLEPPMGSGPYKVATVDQGRAIVYERVKNYWGKDLPINRGLYNFDRVRYDIYRDETVALEAFKAGSYDFRQEYIARNWAKAYDTPARDDGRMIKREVPHKIPQGMQGFLFNTRQAKFADRRVREAIGLAMDFEWANKNLFHSAYKRNFSFFQNSDFMATGLPSAAEEALLTPFKDQLPPSIFTEAYAPSHTDGSGDARANLLQAQALLNEAGWVVKDGKTRVNAETGEPLTVEFLLRQTTFERVLAPMRKNLARLGVEARVRFIDDAQYQHRIDSGDFDIVSIWINRQVFFPGNEQVGLWHSSQAKVKGSSNIGGIQNPVVDALLKTLGEATTLDTLTPAARALDRVLLTEHYVIPHWHSSSFRIAYWNTFGLPNTAPAYDIGLMSWWATNKKDAANAQ